MCRGELQSALSPSYLCSLKLVLHVCDFGYAREGREEEGEKKEGRGYDGGKRKKKKSEQAAHCVNKRLVFFSIFRQPYILLHCCWKTNPQ